MTRSSVNESNDLNVGNDSRAVKPFKKFKTLNP